MWYEAVKTQVVPPIFLVLFTWLGMALPAWGQGLPTTFLYLIGTGFSWTLVFSYFLWAYLWLLLPGRPVSGPVPPPGNAPPCYSGHAVLYYISSCLLLYCLETRFLPGLCSRIYSETPYILGSLSVSALVLCTYLFFTSHRPESLPSLYLFYRGLELHPRIFGVDVKQFTNCRVGVMGWQLFVAAYYVRGLQEHGFHLASFTNFFLQSIYLCLFFFWESGYFYTLDMTLDRAGYYLVWGCLAWVPAFYTHSSYRLASAPQSPSNLIPLICLILGVVAVLWKTLVDFERMWWREGKMYKSPECSITAPGGRRLLVAGSWSIARHLNYTLELAATLAWTLPAAHLGFPPFLYFFFLLGLLLHRIYRDEEKCSVKYGQAWVEYCKRVPYRLIPRVI